MNRILNITVLLSLFFGIFANDKYCGDYSWFRFEDNCYSFEKERLSFYDAEDLCRSKGAHLASIHSDRENDFLLRTYPGGRRWIGLTIYDNEGNHKWSDDTNVDFKKIASKKQYTKEKCYTFFLEQGWRSDHCELRNYPLCKKSLNDVTPSPIPPITTVAPDGNCPIDWLQFNQKCYKFYDEKLEYKEAKSACLALGVEVDLVSIHSAEEQAFLVRQLGNFGASAWIGLNHIDSDEIGHILVFGWTDNSRVDYTNWAPDHPKPGTWKYCTRLSYEGLSKGQWLSDYCSRVGKYGYICSRDPVPNLPTQTPTLSPCSAGYKGYQNACYRFHSNPETWEDAEKICRRDNGHLVSITNSFQEAFLYSLVNGQASFFWNGLKSIEKTSILQWSDKQPLYYSKWLEDQYPTISDKTNSICTSMTSDTLEWKVAPCEKKLPFVCKTTTDVPPSVPSAVIGVCQSRETQLFDVGDEYCYHIATKKNTRLSWGELHRYCITRGMELITITSNHQNKLLLAYVGRKPYDYWLGLIRSLDRESFMWMDGSPLNYTNWEDREPSTWFDRDCVGFSSQNSKWSIKDCLAGLGTICRAKKAVPVS